MLGPMDPAIRPGRASDLRSIRSFSTDTFTWGDYVPDRFEAWLEDANASTIVAVDEGDTPIALSRAVMVSPTELWLHAARVHPDHRRKGIGVAMNRSLLDWGRSQGALVARLLVEDWNEVAQAQVAKAGYRPVSKWVWATRQIVNRDPQPTGNGGKRVEGPERLRSALAVESEPAFLAWSTSRLMRMARGLFAVEWKWRRLTVDDLAAAAKDHSFFDCPSGWAIVSRDTQGTMHVDWMVSTPDDSFRLVRAALDRAIETDAVRLTFSTPATVELIEAFTRIGCEISGNTVWETSL